MTFLYCPSVLGDLCQSIVYLENIQTFAHTNNKLFNVSLISVPLHYAFDGVSTNDIEGSLDVEVCDISHSGANQNVANSIQTNMLRSITNVSKTYGKKKQTTVTNTCGKRKCFYKSENPKSKFSYLTTLQCVSDTPDSLDFVPSCFHCSAKRFPLETKCFCCSDGQISLAIHDAPNELWNLFTSPSTETTHFQTYVRTYNNSFAFTSFGVKYDKDLCKKDKGIYPFRVQGQVYHYINDLFPYDTHPSYLQLYFYDTDHEIEHRLHLSEILDPSILTLLINILKDNPFSIFFRSLEHIPIMTNYNIAIKDVANLDQRVYNAPTASQVAAIWVESEHTSMAGVRDIVVFSNSGSAHKVQYYYGCYDPLQYPLLFPFGESGWHQGIERVDTQMNDDSLDSFERDVMQGTTSATELLIREAKVMEKGCKKRRVVSCREYYCYKLQIRPGDRSTLLHAGRLLQQYVVDMYIKLESSRLDYLRARQKEIRAELYQGIIDSISIGETRGSKVGKRVILPASFIGGPRDMRRRYVDAMCLVQRFGKPDLFITITCNPSWPEITNELLPKEQAQNRPDLIARVFRAKLELLKVELFKKEIFGPVAGYVYVIEFQKRGLPHAHFLLILKEGFKIKSPDLYDVYVSPELPNKSDNPHLYRAVWRHMMHGPCGEMNPKNACMTRNGKCRNHYPKDFCDRSTHNNSYPIYRRCDDKQTIKVRNHLLDNRWVIPYNSYLLAKFDCHINVEICSTIFAVKYLYKYIYKGHDRISFSIVHDSNSDIIDEIKMFQTARWISPPEAMWRIYGFILNEIHPPVVTLQLHLEHQQFVTFQATDNLQRVVTYTPILKTMLTEYFIMNKNNFDARKYLYREFPEHFVWSRQDKMWTTRQQKFAIGRIVNVSPSEGERYYLRLLLNHVRGAFSFDDLKKVGNIFASSFRDAALLRGLLEADNSLEMCLKETAAYQMPSALRHLFVTILVYCNPINSRVLWETFNNDMSKDYMHLPSITTAKQSIFRAFQDISYQLDSMGKNINDYKLLDEKYHPTQTERGSKEIDDELRSYVPAEDLASIKCLNNNQKCTYDVILDRVLTCQAGAFFIDGPGGTGKTYLYQALLALVRSKGFVALATASSGVAASILLGGRTAHSRFKIPLNVSLNSGCNISKQSGLAQLVRAAKLIIWDEATMVTKEAIEAFDRMLQDICECNHIFGAKVVVFGGDFRQVLPVVPKGTIQQTIDASLVKSKLWPILEKFNLTENMRAKLDPQFCEFLLRVGDGSETTFLDDEIKIPESIALPYIDDSSLQLLLNLTFPDLTSYVTHLNSIINRAILAPKNDVVNAINDKLINDLPGDMIEYNSYDKAIDATRHGLEEDFFNTLTPTGFPPHILRLKLNCPIILLRNIDPSKGMCNGTRLICKSFEPNVIHAEIATGHYRGTKVLLPRIPLLPPENESSPFPFQRTQFPIRLSFAMTINKAQGQTLDFVGIYLPQPVFSHGQLYVALSRARNAASVKVLVIPSSGENHNEVHTHNVVYKEVLHLAAVT